MKYFLKYSEEFMSIGTDYYTQAVVDPGNELFTWKRTSYRLVTAIRQFIISRLE